MSDGPHAMREGHWSEWDDVEQADQDGNRDDGDDRDLPTVRDRIVSQLDPDQIHGVAVTARTDSAIYLVAACSTDSDHGDVLDLRTCIYDVEESEVRVSDNGLWVPRDADTLGALTSVVARSNNDVRDGRDAPPLTTSGVEDVDVDGVLSTEVSDTYVRASEDSREWGYGEGPPPAIETVDQRLREAGIETADRYIMLDFGSKAPFGSDHKFADADDLSGNYGVYARRDDPLVLVDVDDPDALDVDLPETYRVTSPHGSAERSHYYYKVDDIDRLADEMGKVNFGPTWGDVRADNQYVVGPGAVLDGCGKDGCTDCDRPDGGRYDVVEDRPIREVRASWLVDLLDADPDVSRVEQDDDQDDVEDAPAAVEEPTADDDGEDADDVETVVCHRCDSEVPETAATVLASDETRTVWVHEGGCP